MSVGTLKIDNLTPSFSASLTLNVNVKALSTNQNDLLGVAYSDGSQCLAGDDDEYVAGVAPITPDLTSATWGPAPIEFVFIRTSIPPVIRREITQLFFRTPSSISEVVWLDSVLSLRTDRRR